jgi:histidinol-phosphatase
VTDADEGRDAERRAWLDLALSIADEADDLARAGFRRDIRVETKPDRTLVSETDRAIERAARERIRAAHPGHGLVGEEYGTQDGDASIRWYIDPIDGTHNFVRGVPLFGTLLAAERDGAMEVAVISAPALRDRWYAWRGGGAWAIHANDPARPARIHVSRVAAIANAQVLYGSRGDIGESGRMPGFDSLVAEAWRDRGFGDFWGYALVAEGAAEAMIEADLSPWDAAAPSLLVEEAGGRWTDIDGQRKIDSGTFIVTNGTLHDEVLGRLRDG